MLGSVPRPETLLFVPVFVASWWQDWRSARAASSYFAADLVGFDVLTAGNYIGLVVGWRTEPEELHLVSTATLAHWTAVFAIYIAWNLTLIKKADEPTRRAFIRFSVAETPIVLVGVVLVAARLLEWWEPVWLQPAGIIVMAVAHVSFLVFWALMSRREQ